MIEVKCSRNTCEIKEMYGTEKEVLTDIIMASLTMLEEAFQTYNTNQKNRKTILKIFEKEFADEFLK